MGEGMPLLLGSGLTSQGEEKHPNFIPMHPPYINPSIKSAFLCCLPELAMQVVLRYQLGIRKPSRNA